MHPSSANSDVNYNGEHHFRRIIDQVPLMVWSAGPDGLCTFFNRTWLDFRGRTMADELGSGWVEGIHPDDRQSRLDAYQRALDARQPFQVDYRLQRADGQYFWVHDTAKAQFDSDGQFVGYIGSCVETKAPARPNASPLTARETQVLTLVADGKSTKEIAAMLSISYKTADSHRSRIMEKLGIHETATLVRYAVRQGVVPA